MIEKRIFITQTSSSVSFPYKYIEEKRKDVYLKALGFAGEGKPKFFIVEINFGKEISRKEIGQFELENALT